MTPYPASIIGCPSTDGYSYTKSPSFRTREFLMGRKRFELKDTEAVYEVSLKLDLTLSQFNAWHTFWNILNKGVDWFTMELVLDTPGPVLCQCHAIDHFSSSYLNVGRYQVSLKVEAVIDD